MASMAFCRVALPFTHITNDETFCWIPRECDTRFPVCINDLCFELIYLPCLTEFSFSYMWLRFKCCSHYVRLVVSAVVTVNIAGLWIHIVWWIGTNVLEEPATSIFRVEDGVEECPSTWPPFPISSFFSYSVSSSTLKMEAAGSSEKLVYCQTTQYHIAEGRDLYSFAGFLCLVCVHLWGKFTSKQVATHNRQLATASVRFFIKKFTV
jgi:hypothetical protein